MRLGSVANWVGIFRSYAQTRPAATVTWVKSPLELDPATQTRSRRSTEWRDFFYSQISIKDTPMRKSLFSIVAASVVLAGAGLASAQTTTSTTTTWTNDQGTTIRKDSTTQKYSSFSDPALKPDVGMALPGTVTLYPLPDTVKVPSPDTYSYAIVNDQPVVVERTT